MVQDIASALDFLHNKGEWVYVFEWQNDITVLYNYSTSHVLGIVRLGIKQGGGGER